MSGIESSDDLSDDLLDDDDDVGGSAADDDGLGSSDDLLSSSSKAGDEDDDPIADIEAELWLAAMYRRTNRGGDAMRAYAEAAIKARLDPRPVQEMVDIAAPLEDEGAEMLASALAELADKLPEHCLRANVLAAIDKAEPAFMARTLAFASRYQKKDHAISLLLSVMYADDDRIRFAASGVLERKAKTLVSVMARLQDLADNDPSERVRDLLKEFRTKDVAMPSDDGAQADYSDGDLFIIEDDDDADYLSGAPVIGG